MSPMGFWTLLKQYAYSHSPEWSVVSDAGGFYQNLSTSDVAKYLINGTGITDFWIAEVGCGDNATSDGFYKQPAWTDSATEGYRYNHATFMDLVLSGVVGLQPSETGLLVINPLVPAQALPWWTADGVLLNGHIVSIQFDLDGTHYKNSAGLKVWVDGVMAKSSPTLTKLTVQL